MTIHTTPHLTGTWVTQETTLGGYHRIFLSGEERHQLLESLAAELGLSFVAGEDRASLLRLAQEVDGDDNDYSNPTNAWVAWQDRAEDMATAITQTLED
jgi:hypothetical protein